MTTFWGRSPQQSKINLENGALVVFTPYIPLLVQSIKSLPNTDRRYDSARKVWLIDPKHGQAVADWIDQYTGEKVFPPPFPSAGVSGQKTTKILRLRYLGGCKEREDGSVSAFGLIDDDWSAIFSERCLRAWFEGIDFDALAVNTRRKPRVETFYTILGIKKDADAGQVKTAFRRMAIQWHPDHCKEPNAHEMFIKIKQAYDALSDSGKRTRYDMGLKLQAEYEKGERAKQLREIREMKRVVVDYRAPLRCGLVMADGFEKLGRFEVQKILGWEDILNTEGKTLVTSWPAGAKEPVEEWI